MSIGTTIKRLRRERSITQEQLAGSATEPPPISRNYLFSQIFLTSVLTSFLKLMEKRSLRLYRRFCASMISFLIKAI